MASKALNRFSFASFLGLALVGCTGDTDIIPAGGPPVGGSGPEIGSTVWHDVNCNGLLEAGEPGLGGVRVMLFNEVGAFLEDSVTDPNGQYLLGVAMDLLPQATYRVAIDESTLPPGFFLTSANVGADETIDSQTNPVTFFLGTSDDMTIDFGYCSTAGGVIGDRVWEDSDCNGVQDPGEPGIDGILVELTYPGGFVRTVQTAGGGAYLFTGLGDGAYSVRVDPVSLPPVYPIVAPCDLPGVSDALDSDCQPAAVTIAGGATDATVDFGYCTMYSNTIGNLVWHDLDCDGIQDAGEPGLQGVLVELLDQGGAVVAQATTAANGAYSLRGVPAGTYVVQVDASTLPPAFFPAPCDAGGDDTVDNDCSPVTVTLAPGQTDATIDFGYCDDYPNSVGDRIWHDLDCDGIQDAGEPGLMGVTILLKDPQGVVLTQATTDGQGQYEFRGLQPGDYTLEVDETTLPVGFFAAPCDAGNDDALDNDCSPIDVTLVTTTNDLTVDFGYCDDYPNSVGDRVWHDLDCDGIQDAGEPGLGGVTVCARDAQAVLVNQAVTDAQGNYTLRGLPPGSYTIEVDPNTLPAGFFAAPCDAGGDDALDNDCSPVDVTLVTTTNDVTVDFGYCDDYPNSVGDRVWHDLDCDGLQDPGEPGLANVALVIRDDQGVVVGQTTTDGQGLYEFRGLQPGTYTIRIDPGSVPAGFFAAPCNVGSDDTIDNDCSPATVTLVTTTNDLTVDFGFCDDYPNSVGDLVWRDQDCDGIQDPGEPGIGGVTVIARDDQAVAVSQAVTDAQGAYTLRGLPPGSYTIEVDPNTLPPGLFAAPCNVGGDDTIDNDCSPAAVTLQTTTNDTSVDFGYCDPFGNSIGDRVWNDLDCDGIQDPGEPGIPGVRVFLVDMQGVQLQQSVTDAQGNYLFRGVGRGSYRIEVAQVSLPPGFVQAPCMVGMDDTVDSNCTPTLVTVTTPTNDLTIDFGFCAPQSSGIGNRVWHDLDCDGIQDPGEPGISNARIFVYDSGTGQLAGMARTNGSGQWVLFGLVAGTYEVEAFPPQGFGYFPAPCDVGGDDSIDSDCTPAVVTLPDNSSFDDTLDFGFCTDDGL